MLISWDSIFSRTFLDDFDYIYLIVSGNPEIPPQHPKTQILNVCLRVKRWDVSQFSTMPAVWERNAIWNTFTSLETSRKNSAAWKTILSIFFQLLILVLIRNVDVPMLFLIMKPFPLKSSVQQVDFQQVLQGPKYLKSHWRQWPWSVFLWRTKQSWDLSTKKPTQKTTWRSMWRNFIEQRGFVGLPAYRTTKG